jgi:YaiO family outer membrane protein
VAAEPAWQFEGGAGADHLSNGAPNWSQVDLALRHRFAPGSLAELSLRRTRRSGLTDEELGGLVAFPLDADWGASLAAAASPSHQVLARFGGRAELARRFDGGWVASAVLGRRLYEADGNSLLALGIERYVEAWRFAASSARPGSTATAAPPATCACRSTAASTASAGGSA